MPPKNAVLGNEARNNTSPAGQVRGLDVLLTWHVPVLVVTALLALFTRFLRPSFLGFFEDDFFYYALIAKHLVLSHRSTFDGLHLTNGYHPLWFLVVVVCYAAFSGIGFFIAVQAVAFAATLFYYFGLLRCFASLQISLPVRRLATLALSLHALLLFRFGMEVTLALPLAIWMLAYILAPGFHWSSRQAFFYGLIASFVILARLDAVLLILTLLAAQIVVQLTASAGFPRVLVSRLLIFFAGCLPLAAYLLINHGLFHAWLPLSGAAKQLKPLWPPSARALGSLFLPFDRTKAVFVYPAVLASAAGFMHALRTARQRAPERNAVLLALFLFPVLHLGALSFLSDWAVWPWYYYSLSLSVFAATAVLLIEPPPATRPAVSRTALAILIAALTLYLATYAVFKHPTRTLLFNAAARFERGHPGIYAMGDGSGTPSYFGGQPVIQLEGLVMDADYLQLLRQRPALHDILTRYHVDYYVKLTTTHDASCRLVIEPAQAGPHSPVATGRICAAPLSSTVEEGFQLDIYRASDVLLP